MSNPKKILDELDRQHITMRPHWSFVLERLVLVLALLLLVIGLIYLGSFLGFVWKQAHFASLTAFGGSGFRFLLRNFPWVQTALMLLGVLALLLTLRRQTHLYRWSQISMLLIVTAGLVLFATLTNATRLHHRLAQVEVRHHAPMIDRWYRGHQPMVRGFITPGNILTIRPNQYTIETPIPEVLIIRLNPSTRLEPQWTPTVGEKIVVLGSRNDDTISAVMIRPADHLPARPPFKLKNRNERNFLFQP